jgi:hypothetical protein
MIYNPFMPSVRFLDHAVFGGGGGGSPAPIAPVGPKKPISNLVSTFPELKNKRYSTVQERIDAETKVIEERRVKALNKTAAETAGTTATDYASGITTDTNEAAAAAQKETDRLNLELSSLKSQLDAAPKEGEPTLRDYKNVDWKSAGFKPGGGPAFMMIVPYYNPKTGQTVNAPNTGYIAPEGWIKGNPTGQFTETAYNPQLKAAYDAKQKELDLAVRRSADIGQVQAGQLRAGQRDMVVKSMTDPLALVEQSKVSTIDPNAAGTEIAAGTGQVTGAVPTATTTAATAGTTAAPTAVTASTIDATKVADQVQATTEGVTAAKGVVADEAKITAASMDPTTTGVKDLTAAQGEATILNNPVQREIQAGEIISGAADAERAAAFTEQVQAATATPSEKATVQGQLTELMQDFEGGDTPAWAAGAMRAANTAMIARGLGASSMAGQAIVQATMEAALPIAMADAQTIAGFEMQNLSNRQQRAMLAAQQRATFMGQEFDQGFQARVQNAGRIADVANMNFTAEQQVALENSRTANTINLANLSNSQAMVLAHAASISQLEVQNLSNQQQAAVQNAQNFMQMDMTNLSNEQQTVMFKAQSNIQALFTDQAADNAAKQFNASSENQTKQFMSNLNAQVNQFNTTQQNAMAQFNAGEENALSKFNASMIEQRNQFNSQNGLVIAQANAQWRQNVATLNTSAQNEANMMAAVTANQFTQAALDQIWQRERDLMDYSFKASESEKDRHVNILLADKKYEDYQKARDDEEDSYKWATAISVLFS